MFFQPVDLTDRGKLVEFLANHFRYFTLNSWNQMTSYALKVKLPFLELTSEEREKAYYIINCPDFGDAVHELLHDWSAENRRYGSVSAGFNGRSSGYLVLYVDWPARGGLDHGCYCFSEWDIEDLQRRVRLVQSFDGLGDRLLTCLKTFL